MLFVDRREDHTHICRELVLPCVEVELEFGDFMFQGNGPEGVVQVGVERKAIRDLLNSITTGRLAGHQIPGLLREYDVVYLIVERAFRPSSTSGELMYQSGDKWKLVEQGRKFRYTDVWKYLNTLEMVAGVHVRNTLDTFGTARMVESLYEWWTKPWSDHHGLDVINKSRQIARLVPMKKPSLVRRVANELKGIGSGRSKAVEAKFPTVEAMVMATQKEWMEVDGVGKIGAMQAYHEIHIGGEE